MPPTTYHLRNESGIEVFTGTIVPAPGGGSQPVAQITLSAADVVGGAVEVVAAPGAGKLVVPIWAASSYVPGTCGFPSNATNGLLLFWDGSGGPSVAEPLVVLGGTGYLNNLYPNTANGVMPSTNNWTPVNPSGVTGINQALLAEFPIGSLPAGGIDFASLAIANGGSGFAPGDLVAIIAGDNAALAFVATVDGGGAITALTPLQSGGSCSVASGVSLLAQTGVGVGATVNIGAIGNGNGSVDLAVGYQIITLA